MKLSTLMISAGVAAAGALAAVGGGWLSGADEAPFPGKPPMPIADAAYPEGNAAEPLVVAERRNAPALLVSQAHAQAQPATPEATDAPATVDETALRYFARQGDQQRLEAEIARLRALYPQWQPPENPLDVPAHRDERLDRMWQLYSEGKYAELRKAIADRQTAEPGWQTPADLVERLALAESREQLVNASDLKQYDTVIRVGSANPTLLTCGDVDTLWRVAEAFALTQRTQRAKDAYLYILNNCTVPQERLATVQKAMALLPRADMNELLATERTIDGVREFEVIRDDLARASVAAGNADPKLTVPAEDLAAVEKLAAMEKLESDALLLGWHHVQRAEPEKAEFWFRKAIDIKDSASAAQGISLALIALRRPAEAEALLYPWRDESADIRAVYMAAVANMLAIVPPPPIAPEVLERIVPEIYEARDVNAAQQIGWYADAHCQFQTARQWFRAALGWKADDEPSSYGLALTSWKLGDLPVVVEVQRQWSGRSQRIAAVGQPEPLRLDQYGRPIQQNNYGCQYPAQYPATAAPQYQPSAGQFVAPAQPVQPMPQASTQYPAPVQYPAAPAQPYPAPVQQQVVAPTGGHFAPHQAPQQPVQYAQPAPVGLPAAPLALEQEIRQSVLAPQPASQQPAAVAQPRQRSAAGPARRSSGGTQRGCTTTIDPSRLAPEAAITRGWCLMEINRPMEAAAAFEVGLAARTEQGRRDAAYGQSLAYLRLGLADEAAVAAAKVPQTRQRSIELQTALLSAQATGQFEAKRYTEALMSLDHLARIAPERVDLMVLRGYAYLALNRFDEAEQVFRAAAGTGDREAIRGISSVRAARSAAAGRD